MALWYKNKQTQGNETYATTHTQIDTHIRSVKVSGILAGFFLNEILFLTIQKLC